MNYTHIYNSLIVKRKFEVLSDGFERHHIIPRSLGGDNKKSNIVRLTPREHFIAHLLLARIYRGTPKSYPMIKALFMMRCSWNHEGRVLNSRWYEILKMEHSKQQSTLMRGRGNPLFGKKWFHKGGVSKIFDPSNVPDGWEPGKFPKEISKVCVECGSTFKAKANSRSKRCPGHRRKMGPTDETSAKYKELWEEYKCSGLSIYKFAESKGILNYLLYRNWKRIGLL